MRTVEMTFGKRVIKFQTDDRQIVLNGHEFHLAPMRDRIVVRNEIGVPICSVIEHGDRTWIATRQGAIDACGQSAQHAAVAMLTQIGY